MAISIRVCVFALAAVSGPAAFFMGCGSPADGGALEASRTVEAGANGDDASFTPDVARPSTADATSAGDAESRDAGAPGCVPSFTTCAGLCGPVIEPCTGDLFECGGCAEGLACDRDSHRCIEPKATCDELEAECGRIRNTCGTRLDCGDCEEGFECDASDNRCVACTDPTCRDLGYECGPAWLGCGSRQNLTDCGDCDEGFVCNVAYNRCEPAPVGRGGDCVPEAALERCAADGAECGFVSDGCGGLVACGDCPDGSGCGTEGIQNRCGMPEPEWECLAEGRECGRVQSACGNRRVNCGGCARGLVCNENGKCGEPCTPSLPPEAEAVECGVFSDGCGGSITKPCQNGGVCADDGTCCAPKTCAGDYASRCGLGLPDGCGGTLDCNCGGGGVCESVASGEVGSCCTRRDCGSTCGPIDDGCGGIRTCRCQKGFACDAPSASDTGTCCALPECGGEGTLCNASISNDCGTVQCPASSCGPGLACGNSSNGTRTCCRLPTRPSPGFCGTVTNACGSRSFGCGSGSVCVDGTCCALPTCGNQCGVTLENACGSTTCSCSGDDRCMDGTCCSPRTCGGFYSRRCGAGLDDGCGGVIDCPCNGAGNTCSVSAAGQTGTCSCDALTCADYPNQCGNLPNGCGGTLSCTCSDHGLPGYMMCGRGGSPGVCGCVPTPCGGRCGIVDNGCGGSLDCGPC